MVMTRNQMMNLMSNPVNILENKRSEEEQPIANSQEVLLDSERKPVDNAYIDNKGRLRFYPSKDGVAITK